MSDGKTTAREVAEYLAVQINEHGFLYQSHAVQDIITHFGHEFLYAHRPGGRAIRPDVLKEFTKLVPTKKWDNRSLVWRLPRDGR